MSSFRLPARVVDGLGATLLVGALLSGHGAEAASYTYTLSDGWLRSEGQYPIDFAGTMTWDTKANGGSGGWREWNIQIGSESTSGGVLFTFDSSNGGSKSEYDYLDLVEGKSYKLDGKTSAAGLFTSSLGSGANALDGTSNGLFTTCSPEGSGCVAGKGKELPTVFSIYQVTNENQPFAWSYGKEPVRKEGRYNYFRLPLDASEFASLTTPGTLRVADDTYEKYTNSGFGWSSLSADPAAKAEASAGEGGATCAFTIQEEPPKAGTCPFGGLPLRMAALQPRVESGSTDAWAEYVTSLKITLSACTDDDGKTCAPPTVVTEGNPGTPAVPAVPGVSPAPAPLASAGSVAALVWSRRLRRRLRSAA